MIKSFLVAIGLVLIIEGILPFLTPSKWRRSVLLIASQNNRFLRRLGLILMVIGAVIVFTIHNLL
jgi:uncharacterized protein YjeT (DUF2065 family)